MRKQVKHTRQATTQLSYKGRTGEVNTLPSETVPDQSLSVREILINHTRGILPPRPLRTYYDEDNDLPDPKTLDLAELQEYQESIAQEIKDKQKNLRFLQKKQKESKSQISTTGDTSTNEPK